MKKWVVYLLRCADGTFYCGVTNDLKKRLAAHNAGKGAKYTRARLPARVAAKSRPLTKSAAHRKEHFIKSLPRTEKRKAVRSI